MSLAGRAAPCSETPAVPQQGGWLCLTALPAAGPHWGNIQALGCCKVSGPALLKKPLKHKLITWTTAVTGVCGMPGAPWGWLDLWEGWAEVGGRAGHCRNPGPCGNPPCLLMALGGSACPGLPGCPQAPGGCEPLSIPCLLRAQLANLVLSLRWGCVQGKPRVGLAEPWAVLGSRREQGGPGPPALGAPSPGALHQEDFPLSAAGDVLFCG